MRTSHWVVLTFFSFLLTEYGHARQQPPYITFRCDAARGDSCLFTLATKSSVSSSAYKIDHLFLGPGQIGRRGNDSYAGWNYCVVVYKNGTSPVSNYPYEHCRGKEVTNIQAGETYN